MTSQTVEIAQYRPLLFSVAYNMLGSVADAEDLVQDTFASWLASPRTHVENPRQYLVRAVSNKCLTHLQQLRKQREAYPGTWLPEPVYTQPEAEEVPLLSIGMLYLLERLSPQERAVLILKEAFDVPYAEIAATFGLSQESCRQHLSRARKKLAADAARFQASKEQHEKTLQRFLQASFTRNLQELVQLLREDVTVYADGGGNARAVPKPVGGKDKVLRLLQGGMEKSPAFARSEVLYVNGAACGAFYLSQEATAPDLLITIDADAEGHVRNVYFMANPVKLRHQDRPV